MSNIKTAVAAIKAEMKHAQDGVKFYQAKVASLEHALSNLEGVDLPVVSTTRSGKGRAKSAPPKGNKAARGGSLPATGKDFWPGLLGPEPKSPAEIFEAAVQALGLKPTKEQARKLAQRQANALSVLTKAGTISSTGDGRGRRYFI